MIEIIGWIFALFVIIFFGAFCFIIIRVNYNTQMKALKDFDDFCDDTLKHYTEFCDEQNKAWKEMYERHRQEWIDYVEQVTKKKEEVE